MPWLVKSVFFANVTHDCIRYRLLTGVEVSRRQPNQSPGNGDHNENRRDRNYQASDDEAKHLLVGQAFLPVISRTDIPVCHRGHSQMDRQECLSYLITQTWSGIIPLGRIALALDKFTTQER